MIMSRGSRTSMYVIPTNQNKCCGKSRGDKYIGGPLDFKVGGHPTPSPLLKRP